MEWEGVGCGGVLEWDRVLECVVLEWGCGMGVWGLVGCWSGIVY